MDIPTWQKWNKSSHSMMTLFRRSFLNGGSMASYMLLHITCIFDVEPGLHRSMHPHCNDWSSGHPGVKSTDQRDIQGTHPPALNDSKVLGAIMGPIWGREDPGGPHVGPMNFAIWDGDTTVLWEAIHWQLSFVNLKIIMMPTLLSLVAPQIVVPKNQGPNSI